MKWLLRGVIVLVLLLMVARITSPDPKFNPASLEPTPLKTKLLAFEKGWTLAQRQSAQGKLVTYLVLGYDETGVNAVALNPIKAIEDENPLLVFEAFTATELTEIALDSSRAERIDFLELEPAAGEGSQHLAIGTNFPEHAEEAASDSVFNFPKFGTATPARTSVAYIDNGLLDYEVELCTRFANDVDSVEQFDQVTKGFFLCGDFTERARLLRLLDPDNLDSGYGFSDAKSGEGFFPSGALLVIPNDWREFIRNERMTTSHNDRPRQDARGGEMILDFKALTDKTLKDMQSPRFWYQDGYVKLAPNAKIERDMILMSGTSEGVIFTLPTRADIIDGIAAYVFSGAWLHGTSAIDFLIEFFIAREHNSGHFLQVGDTVHFRSSHMGDIKIAVVDAIK